MTCLIFGSDLLHKFAWERCIQKLAFALILQSSIPEFEMLFESVAAGLRFVTCSGQKSGGNRLRIRALRTRHTRTDTRRIAREGMSQNNFEPTLTTVQYGTLRDSPLGVHSLKLNVRKLPEFRVSPRNSGELSAMTGALLILRRSL